MSSNGDLHNFGQHVRKVERASGIFYQKPRPIFWESLFFGKSSPLRNIFLKIKDSPLATRIVDCIYNIEIDFDESRVSGFSKEIKTEKISASGDEESLFNFGLLLAYCHCFGIQDLHRGNLIQRSNHLQVIDAEVVFAKNFIPNETLLLPFKNTDFKGCGLSYYFENKNDISPEQAASIFSGYAHTLKLIYKIADEIKKEIHELNLRNKRIPIRLILRDTLIYKSWHKEKPSKPFFKEELVQIGRGDVPYFFKYLNDPKIYYYTSSSGAFAAVDLPKEHIVPLKTDAVDIDQLLALDRVQNDLFITGLLSLSRGLIPSDFTGKLALSQTEGIIISTSNIILESEWGTYQSLRPTSLSK